MDYLKKASLNKIGLDIDTVRDACKKAPVSIARFYGQVSKVEYGTGDNGPWVKLKGQIEAVNLLTGVVFRSGAMFLPGVASDALEGQLNGAKSEDANASVQFAIEIGCKKSKSPVGYEYTAGSLIKEDESDALAQLRNSLPTQPVLTNA